VEMAKGVDGEHVALAFKWRRQTERERERERGGGALKLEATTRNSGRRCNMGAGGDRL
jgi:hypothetical protein